MRVFLVGLTPKSVSPAPAAFWPKLCHHHRYAQSDDLRDEEEQINAMLRDDPT